MRVAAGDGYSKDPPRRPTMPHCTFPQASLCKRRRRGVLASSPTWAAMSSATSSTRGRLATYLRARGKRQSASGVPHARPRTCTRMGCWL